MLFDRDVSSIVGSSASDIMERQMKLDDSEGFPQELFQLLDKVLAFKIEVSEYNLKSDYPVYTIQKICDDPAIR